MDLQDKYREFYGNMMSAIKQTNNWLNSGNRTKDDLLTKLSAIYCNVCGEASIDSTNIACFRGFLEEVYKYNFDDEVLLRKFVMMIHETNKMVSQHRSCEKEKMKVEYLIVYNQVKAFWRITTHILAFILTPMNGGPLTVCTYDVMESKLKNATSDCDELKWSDRLKTIVKAGCENRRLVDCYETVPLIDDKGNLLLPEFTFLLDRVKKINGKSINCR